MSLGAAAADKLDKYESHAMKQTTVEIHGSFPLHNALMSVFSFRFIFCFSFSDINKDEQHVTYDGQQTVNLCTVLTKSQLSIMNFTRYYFKFKIQIDLCFK